MSDLHERSIAIGGVSREEAPDLLGNSPEFDAASIPAAIPNFAREEYPSFTVEWSMIDKDLQMKFFLPTQARIDSPEASTAWMKYWLERFPSKLDPVAREYFEAEYPRLVVKWTEEVQSWWMRASAYSFLLDPAGFLKGFFTKLDEALQKKGEA